MWCRGAGADGPCAGSAAVARAAAGPARAGACSCRRRGPHAAGDAERCCVHVWVEPLCAARVRRRGGHGHRVELGRSGRGAGRAGDAAARVGRAEARRGAGRGGEPAALGRVHGRRALHVGHEQWAARVRPALGAGADAAAACDGGERADPAGRRERVCDRVSARDVGRGRAARRRALSRVVSGAAHAERREPLSSAARAAKAHDHKALVRRHHVCRAHGPRRPVHVCARAREHDGRACRSAAPAARVGRAAQVFCGARRRRRPRRRADPVHGGRACVRARAAPGRQVQGTCAQVPGGAVCAARRACARERCRQLCGDACARACS